METDAVTDDSPQPAQPVSSAAPRFLNNAEAAEFLRLSPRTLHLLSRVLDKA